MSELASESMSGTAVIRVALVGLGWAGRSIWLPRLIEHPEFDVVAVVDPAPAARAAVTGAARLADVAELDRDRVDLAVVAVPNHLHAGVACRLLDAGIPVFLEKPVCLSSAEADALAAAERAGGAVLLAGSAARHRADVLALRAATASLGRIRHVDLAWVRARGVPDAGGWFTRRDLSGGGALVDLGWHLLDTLTLFLGPVTFEQVIGAVSDDFLHDGSWRAAWRDDHPAPVAGGDVEDTARGFLVSEHGVSVSLRASWASHEPFDYTAITIEGSAGTASLRCTFGFSPNRRGGPVLTVVRDGRTTELAVPAEPIGAEYRRQLDELPALLTAPARRGDVIADARRTIRVIERLYHSARLPAGV